MRAILLAGMIAFAAPVYAAELPDEMLGSWSMGDEQGIMDRVPDDQADFDVQRDRYHTVDFECEIKYVSAMMREHPFYLVQAVCHYDGGDDVYPPKTNLSEFEMVGDRLKVTPVHGS